MNVKTGKEESFKQHLKRMEKILDGQPDYIIGFYNFMRNSGKTNSYKTHEVYTKYVIRFFNNVKKQPKDVTMDDVNSYLAMVSINQDGSKKSGSYLVAVYSGLKKFFHYLKSSKRIEENPMKEIERPAPKSPDKVERTFLTKEEVQDCIDYMYRECRDDKWCLRNLALFVVLVSTGMRATACREINIENIDLANKCIRTIDKGDKVFTYYLSEDKMRIVYRWMVNRRSMLEDQEEKTQALFISSHKTRISADGIDKIIKKITQITGKKISPHKLRGTFATACIDSGASLFEVQKLMGHSSSKTTIECYIQGQDEKIKEAGLKATSFIKV